MEAKPVKNVSSLLLFSGHSELETGLLSYPAHPSILVLLTDRKLMNRLYACKIMNIWKSYIGTSGWRIKRMKIIEAIDATFAVVKRKPDKFRIVQDTNPWLLRYRPSALTVWANKPTGSRSYSWFVINHGKGDDEIMNNMKIIRRNAGWRLHECSKGQNNDVSFSSKLWCLNVQWMDIKRIESCLSPVVSGFMVVVKCDATQDYSTLFLGGQSVHWLLFKPFHNGHLGDRRKWPL